MFKRVINTFFIWINTCTCSVNMGCPLGLDVFATEPIPAEDPILKANGQWWKSCGSWWLAILDSPKVQSCLVDGPDHVRSPRRIYKNPIFLALVHSWSAIFSQSSRCHQTKQWWFLTLRALGELNPLDSHRAHCKKAFQVAGHVFYLENIYIIFIHFMQLEDSAYMYL